MHLRALRICQTVPFANSEHRWNEKASSSASTAVPQLEPLTNKQNEPKAYIRRKKNPARSERGAIDRRRDSIALRADGKHDPENHGSAGEDAHGGIKND